MVGVLPSIAVPMALVVVKVVLLSSFHLQMRKWNWQRYWEVL